MSPIDQPLIRLDQTALTYPGPPPVRALGATDLDIASGEYVAIMGPSGAGKSSLLNLIGLLEAPTTGTISINGSDTGQLTHKQLADLRAATYGFVFQRFHLMAASTAIENVELALMYQGIRGEARRQAALAALERVGLASRANHRPAELSGGEQQRVAIARALACDQPCILADEPTGNLDSVTTASILDLLDTIWSEGTTIVCVTHNTEVAERAHRHLEVRDGHVSESVGAT